MFIEQRIAEKIEQSKEYFEQLPGIVIIHHIFNFNVLYMSESGLKELSTTLDGLKAMGADYHKRYFNQNEAKDYVPKLSAMLERNNKDEAVSFFQQVRASEDAEWKWYLSSIKIFMWDDDGKPLLTITIAIPIDPQHHITSKVERLLEENNFFRQHKNVFAGLSKRELQILRQLAYGRSSREISTDLYISEETVKTHRRNIKRKIGAVNDYDIIKFATAFDII